jgi:hypothetical protein
MRMPLWAAVAVVAAAYVLRSALRGWDFRPDLPIDAVLAVTLVALVLLRWFAGRWASADQGDKKRPAEVEREDGGGGEPRHDEDLGGHIDP